MKTNKQEFKFRKMLERKLCVAVIKEAVHKGFADIFSPDWNQKAHVEITLTIEEIKCAAKLIGFKPSRKELSKSAQLAEWDDYINELDGVE